MARKPEGDLKQARASALAHASFKSDEDWRSEAAECRAKTHYGREDPIASFGSAQSLAWWNSERVFTRCAQEDIVEYRLRNRLRDDDERHLRSQRLNGRTTTLVFAAALAAVTLWRFPVVVVGSRGVLVDLGGVMMFCVVRVPLLMRRYGVVLVNRTGIGCAGFAVIRAIANAHYAADSNAHEPQQRARPRENAEQGTDFRLRGNFQLQPCKSESRAGAMGCLPHLRFHSRDGASG